MAKTAQASIKIPLTGNDAGAYAMKQINPDGKYVRAELYGADGIVIGTQPFGMVKN